MHLHRNAPPTLYRKTTAVKGPGVILGLIAVERRPENGGIFLLKSQDSLLSGCATQQQ
jgi:hypothetical protein